MNDDDERRDMIEKEFRYISPDGTLQIDAQVAAYSPKVGLSLLAVGKVDKDGKSIIQFEDKDGNICVGMVSPKCMDFHREVDKLLDEIKLTGVLDCRTHQDTIGWGNPVCPF